MLGVDLSISMEDRPVPAIGVNDVLVEVRSVGVCGSDIHYFESGRIGDFVVEAPLVLGHEASGSVVAVGEGVTDLPVGSRVALEPGVPCGSCRDCRRGAYNVCPEVRFFATPPVDGAFCDFVVLPRAFVHPVPDHVSWDAAALVEPLAVGVWACGKGGVTSGSQVLVTGAGPIGVIVGLVARAQGAASVVVSDVNSDRRAFADSLGLTSVDAVVDELPEVDVLVECSGARAAIHGGIGSVRPGGRVVLVGMSSTGVVDLPVGLLQSRELWLTGTFRYAHAYPAAIGLLASGRVSVDSLVSKTFSLEQVREALEFGRAHPDAMKVIVRVSE